MYSYDVERLRQLAQAIRQKGAKKPQRAPPKKAPVKKKLLKRGATGARSHQASKVRIIDSTNDNQNCLPDVYNNIKHKWVVMSSSLHWTCTVYFSNEN